MQFIVLKFSPAHGKGWWEMLFYYIAILLQVYFTIALQIMTPIPEEWVLVSYRNTHNLS